MSYPKVNGFSYDGKVKERVKGITFMTDRSKKLFEYACKPNVGEFAKILAKYAWSGTRDTTMVLMITAFFVLAEKSKDKDFRTCLDEMNSGEIGKLFKALGCGMGPQAVTHLKKLSGFHKLFVDLVLPFAIYGDDKAEQRESVYTNFEKQVSKIKKWRLSAATVRDYIIPVLKIVIPERFANEFISGFENGVEDDVSKTTSPDDVSKTSLPIVKSKEAEDIPPKVKPLPTSVESGDASIFKGTNIEKIDKKLVGRPNMLTPDEMKVANAIKGPRYAKQDEAFVNDVSTVVNVLRIGKFKDLKGIFELDDFVKQCKGMGKGAGHEDDWLKYLAGVLSNYRVSERGEADCRRILNDIGVLDTEKGPRNIAEVLSSMIKKPDDDDYGDSLQKLYKGKKLKDLYDKLRKFKIDNPQDKKAARAYVADLVKEDPTKLEKFDVILKSSMALNGLWDIQKVMQSLRIDNSVILSVDLLGALKNIANDKKRKEVYDAILESTPPSAYKKAMLEKVDLNAKTYGAMFRGWFNLDESTGIGGILYCILG